ncbi:ATP-binding protein [Nocardia vermiculata]|uniref:histidine kinase n=1 Tax=Nocardia vermiculata TaxID=257274 RepID=A0A846XUF4_9NOCA|nr:ATP-binding protein [Nocardia vermiculata]NKY48728.1 HAMP domain-containing protein [Nocardia vermiculata]
MGSAPRPWQKSLSNLSVTSKVGIVLLLPVVLASAFAVLRIKDELGTISQLDTAGEQAQIIRPTLDFGSAANNLAVTMGNGDGIVQSAVDQAAGRFDQAAADLQTALQNSPTDKRVETELTQSLAAGRTLRNSLQGGAPQEVVKQASEVNSHISNAVSSLATPKETSIERLYVQMGVVAIARQMFTQQQLALESGAISDNPAVLAQVLIATGAELTMINQYAVVQPDSALKPDVLLGAAQARIAALSQNSVEPIDVPGVVQSLQTSTATYDEATNHLVDLIDTGLKDRSIDARSTVLRDVALVVVTLLAGLALALGVARSLVVPIRRLRRDSLQVAHTDLPAELAVVRGGGATPEIVPVGVQTTEEIGQLARAVDDMHHQALYLAAEQARLRLQISNMFETLSRRSQSLVEQQLALIEDLERDEDDSGRLQSLFRLDHLATRMRRNGDNLLVLAGTALRRGHLPPVPLSDMLWSAVSQVEDYQRVEIGSVPDGIVAGEPAVDIEHLLAELIDNSLRYSPPNTPVAVSVSRAVDGGYLIEITDRGLGMSADDMDATNERLASGGEVTIETARRMGLFVVGRLASRHTITVGLRRTSSMAQQPGITASVHLPGALVSPAEAAAPPPITSFTTPVPEFPAPVADFPGLPQRPLAAVPNPPSMFGETAEPPAEFVPSSGLPQRRSAGAPDAEATPVTRLTPIPDISESQRHAPAGDGVLRGADEQHPAYRDDTATGQQQRVDTTTGQQRRVDTPVDDTEAARTRTPAADRDSEFAPLPSRRPAPADPRPRPQSESIDIWAETAVMPPAQRAPDHEHATLSSHGATLAPPRPDADAPAKPGGPTPIYQRMVSEWLVEPSSEAPAAPSGAWSSPADAGWAAAADASAPTANSRTTGGLPIRRPGAQLVPGGLTQDDPAEARDPEEIRNNLSRHLSGVRSGRVSAQNDPVQHDAAQRNDAQQNDGGFA